MLTVQEHRLEDVRLLYRLNSLLSINMDLVTTLSSSPNLRSSSSPLTAYYQHSVSIGYSKRVPTPRTIGPSWSHALTYVIPAIHFSLISCTYHPSLPSSARIWFMHNYHSTIFTHGLLTCKCISTVLTKWTSSCCELSTWIFSIYDVSFFEFNWPPLPSSIWWCMKIVAYPPLNIEMRSGSPHRCPASV